MRIAFARGPGAETRRGGKATGGGRRPKGACPVRRSCVRGDGHKNGTSEPGRPRPDAAFGSPQPTFAGGAKATRLPRAVRPEDTLPIHSKPDANRLSQCTIVELNDRKAREKRELQRRASSIEERQQGRNRKWDCKPCTVACKTCLGARASRPQDVGCDAGGTPALRLRAFPRFSFLPGFSPPSSFP